MRSFASEFGLSLAARTRVKGTENQGGELAAFLKRG